MIISDLGLLPYRDAWGRQEHAHRSVVGGGEEQLLLVEHPPVITLGRRPGLSKNILAPAASLQHTGVDVVESDRGGDVTLHAPGQLVAYPIIRLNDHKLSVGAYVRRLQEIVIATLDDLGVSSQLDPAAVGVWTCPTGPNQLCNLAKICAFGVRIRRGVSMHGLALNVTTDLSLFNLIVPCGIADRSVTSIQKILGQNTPDMQTVRQTLTSHMQSAFTPVAKPSAAR